MPPPATPVVSVPYGLTYTRHFTTEALGREAVVFFWHLVSGAHHLDTCVTLFLLLASGHFKAFL